MQNRTKEKQTATLWGGTFVLLLSMPVVFISLNHLFPFSNILVVSTRTAGFFGWTAAFASLLFLCRRFALHALCCFCFFFLLGFQVGPYLEPPVDHFEHLQRIHSYCGMQSNDVSSVNEGLWHYSMAGLLVCADARQIGPEAKLRRIDASQGMFWAVLLTLIFAAARRLGIPGRWAFFSSLIALLFLGTNRFSFFSYYSLAPSISSLFLYWLWICFFFFRCSNKALLSGITVVLLILPVLFVNHLQEGFFLLLIVFCWLLLNFHERFWRRLCKIEAKPFAPGKKLLLKWGYFVSLIIILFVLPQLEFIKLFLANGNGDAFETKRQLIFNWHGLDLMGRVWGFRVNDTLGWTGALLLLLGLPTFWPGFLKDGVGSESCFAGTTHFYAWSPHAQPMPAGNSARFKLRLYLLAMLPFLGYTVPLLHEAWLAKIHPGVYYRLCYSSLFWLFFAWFCYNLEQRLLSPLSAFSSKARLLAQSCLYTLFLVGLLVLSGMRSEPVYGKLDFLRLDSRPWWPAWQPMITELLAAPRPDPICTDPVTSMVLTAVFGLDAAPRWQEQGQHLEVYAGQDSHTFLKFRSLRRKKLMNIMACKQLAENSDYVCVINLHGFAPSWVGTETGHWQPDLTFTRRAYQLGGHRGRHLERLLEKKTLENCRVFLNHE